MKKFLVFVFVLVLVLTACAGQPAQQPTIPPLQSTQQPAANDGTWFTAKLQLSGDLLTYSGPDLSTVVGRSQAYTYYSRGVWVALDWLGYKEGKNTWQMTAKLKQEKPNWASNQDWSVDFLWPSNLGSFPVGATQGTSSK